MPDVLARRPDAGHAGNPGFIELWDPESGTVRETLAGHSNLVTSLAFAPAGRALLSRKLRLHHEAVAPGPGRPGSRPGDV